MKLPSWIIKTAEDLGEIKEPVEEGFSTQDGHIVNFSDPLYHELLDKYGNQQLSDEQVAALEQVEYLRDLINVAVARLHDGAITKEAAAPSKPLSAVPDLPAEVPPTMPSGKQPKVLPARIKEPETSKWKEIRFNKRTGTWQGVVSTRHVRNFNSEAEAVDFIKKA